MRPFVRFPATAVDELTTDQFVKACVAFQQAKAVLSQHLNGADAMACDNVSRAVYNLANRALAKKTYTRKVDSVGRKLTAVDAVVQAVRGKKKFDKQAIIEAMKRQGTLPKSQNINGYLSAILSANSQTVFKRITPGIYSLRKTVAKKKLVFAAKDTKALPAKTT